MNFDQIVVKESPGLCRCCLSEGCYKDLGSEYTWMNETEIYADMLLECFDISISQHNEGPNGPNRLICEVCITRLRDACNFKKQVLDSEKKFVDMVGRGEFKSKVLVFESDMKLEPDAENIEETEVEYLEESMDYEDDDKFLSEIAAEAATSADIIEAPPAKAKRGRPKRTTTVIKQEKKVKVPKLEEKPRSSKTATKESTPPALQPKAALLSKDWRQKLAERKYIEAVLSSFSVIPFRWCWNKYVCFYCYQSFNEASKLQSHTRSHKNTTLTKIARTINKSSPIKLDISEMKCLKCNKHLEDYEELINHLKDHNLIQSVEKQCFLTFKLRDDSLPCLKCPKTFDFFGTLYSHFNKEHLDGAKRICETCGQYFFSEYSFTKHVRTHHKSTDFKCRHCDTVFDVEAKRTSHEFKEHDIKTVVCYECKEKFGTRYLRNVHIINTHKAVKFPCDQCSKIFTHKCRLLKHYKRVHLKEKNYTCSVCGDKFYEQRTLTVHSYRHSRETLQCQVCTQVFTNKKKFHDHSKTHKD